MEGLAYALSDLLHIYVGVTFSNGVIDFLLYGVLQGQTKSHWMYTIPLIIVYFFAYFFIFRFLILKWDLKTPGRENDGEDVNLVSKADYQKKTMVGFVCEKTDRAHIDKKSANILIAVGGIKNITEIDCCATRLRLTLVNSNIVNESLLKTTGALGVIIKENAIQVIYGPSVTIVKSNFEELVDMIRVGKVSETEIVTIGHELNGVTPENEKSKENPDATAVAENTRHAIEDSAPVNGNHRKVKHGEIVNFGFNSSAKFEYVIKDPVGIHARPAGELAKFVNGLECNVVLKNGEKTASGKSVLELMMLGACCGSRLEVYVTGPGAKQSMQQLEKFMKERM